MTFLLYPVLPNLDPWMNQQNEEEFSTPSNFEKQLLSIIDERQKMIRPNCHPTYNERHEKIIEMIDWTLKKYRASIKDTQQNEKIIIDNIIEELDKKRGIAINKKKRAQLKDEVWKYGGEEDAIDYVLFRIRELTGRLI